MQKALYFPPPCVTPVALGMKVVDRPRLAAHPASKLLAQQSFLAACVILVRVPVEWHRRLLRRPVVTRKETVKFGKPYRESDTVINSGMTTKVKHTVLS